MKILNYFWLLALCIVVGLASCHKEEIATQWQENEIQETKPEIRLSVVDGALHFATPEDFKSTVIAMGEMSKEQHDSWESTNDFTSIRSLTNNVLEQIENTPSVEEKERLVLENAHLVKSTQAEGFIPAIDAIDYRNVCNVDGIFYIGHTMNKFSGGKLIAIEHVTPEKLLQAERSLTSNAELGIAVIDVVSENSDRGNCGTSKYAWKSINGGKAVELYAYASPVVYYASGQLKGYVSVRFLANAKRLSWGKWVSALVNIEMDGMTFEANLSGYISSGTVQRATGWAKSIQIYGRGATHSLSNSSATARFEKVRGWASTDKLGSSKAQISCGFSTGGGGTGGGVPVPTDDPIPLQSINDKIEM